MPPTARLPTVEFRSLLLAPIRVRLRTLHTFARPQCAPVALRRAAPVASCLVQRRSLHLYKTAKARTALGMHKVLDFGSFQVKPPSESTHRVNVVRWKKGKDWQGEFRVVQENLSLEELYEQISPGRFLYQADEIPKKYDGKFEVLRDQNIPAQFNNYAIGIAHEKKYNTVDAVSKKTKQTAQLEGKQLGALKNVCILLSNPVSYRHLSLDRAYQFIELGSPVEFRIRLCTSAVAMKNKVMAPDAELVPWMMDHFPHLRPDFILKAMPEGTEYMIDPVSDGRMVQFVLSRPALQQPKLDLTTRLFRVKKAVEKTLPNNPMAQRYIYRKTKQPGRQVFDEGQLRDMTEEEKAEQAKIKENAAKKRRMTINVPYEEVSGEEKPPPRSRLNKAGLNRQTKRKVDELKARPEQRWQSRGSKKAR